MIENIQEKAKLPYKASMLTSFEVQLVLYIDVKIKSELAKKNQRPSLRSKENLNESPETLTIRKFVHVSTNSCSLESMQVVKKALYAV